MAWRYRKRIKVAPGIYMNVSKSGISTSVGVRGASVTFGKKGFYFNTGIPGTGFYKRQKIGLPSTPSADVVLSRSTRKIHSKAAYTFTAVLCGLGALICLCAAPIGLIGTFIYGAGVWANLSNRKKYYGAKTVEVNDRPSFITDAQKALSESTDDRKKRILSNFINTVEAIDSIEDEEYILKSLNKKPAKNAELISIHSAELVALKSKLDDIKYDIDESVTAEILSLYESLCKSFENLMTSQKIWVQTSKTHNMKAKSSASSLVELKKINFGVGVFNYIKSKFDVPVIPVDNQLLYLYPEYAILSKSPSQFEIVDYTNMSIIYTSIHFNEPGSYPTDAEKIGTTWEYVNKNGGPDKRFADNRQISVVKYGGINLTINGKISVIFQISNAAFADKFCDSFNKLCSSIRKDDEIPTDVTTKMSTSKTSVSSEPNAEMKSSLFEIIQYADKLFRCLCDMSCDSQVAEALDNQRQLDSAKELKLGNGKIDSRLGCVAANDLIKCFDGLGHSPNMSTDEGRAIGIILSRILVPDNDVWHNEELMKQSEGKKVFDNCYTLFKQNIHVDFDPDRFLLIEMLRHEGVDEETVNKWAVLFYRYALLIAKIDGQLSEIEQRWLANILSFTENGAVKVTNHNIKSKKIALSTDLDPLFEDVARMVVSDGITCSTSKIQRKFCIGYNRAGKIMDQLEMAGVVGPLQNNYSRFVLMDSLTLDDLLHNGNLIIESVENVTTTSKKTDTVAKQKNIQCRNISNPMRELEDLIGLASVKTEVSNIYNLVKIQKVRASKGLNAPNISYHCVFTGNPGTGKTTVARLVAQIYKELGILSKGHLVETDRSGLVAEYVGQTAVKTNKIIDSALDGVLFIDEAYSLVQNGGCNDFGLESIATLLKRMEDNRDRLVVILAGYSDEMKQFIDSNPGLQSRFNRYINFEDYSADELGSIFEFNLSKYDYKLTGEAVHAIKEVMTEAVANKDKNFGNARFVRNLFEKTLERQAKRLAASPNLSSLTEEALTEITEEDIR